LTNTPGLRLLTTSRQTLDLTMEADLSACCLCRRQPAPALPGVCWSSRASTVCGSGAGTAIGFPDHGGERPGHCRPFDRLEGFPWRWELAAAWGADADAGSDAVTPVAPFDLLVSKRKDLPARHLSLRAAIEGSYFF